ncbi:MAG: zf-HC2 domain-containing protein [Planctomycetota bacterium]|nr:MAG: zf-HC2 domain-containing protein [Planctomycetota bacterium]
MEALQPNQDLSCDEVEALLPLVVDGVLDEASEPELFRHLAHCPRCQTSLATYDLVDLALSRGHPLQPSRAQVLQWRLPAPWAAAACLLLGLGLGAMALQGYSSQPSESGVVSGLAGGDLQILEVLPPGPGQDQPIFVVRDGDTVRVISGGQLDGGRPQSRPRDVQPVTHGRAIDPVRSLGEID